jgi:hypothetical protein
MNKTILIAIGGAIILTGFLFTRQAGQPAPLAPPNEISPATPTDTSPSPMTDSGDLDQQRAFAQCLVDAGMVVYVSRTCPACSAFSRLLGGYDVADGLFVECSLSGLRCEAEMQTNYVPEIQINGELFEGDRDLESLSSATGCDLP